MGMKEFEGIIWHTSVEKVQNDEIDQTESMPHGSRGRDWNKSTCNKGTLWAIKAIKLETVKTVRKTHNFQEGSVGAGWGI